MKKTLYIGIALATLGMLSACDQSLLDIPQKGVVAIEDYYQTEADAEAALVAVYNQAMTTVSTGTSSNHINAPSLFCLTVALSDDNYWGSNSYNGGAFGREINEYRSTFGSNSSTIVNNYSSFYHLVYSCNLLLDHFTYGQFGAEVDRYISEARVWRAYAYLHLATYWGNPPLVTHVLTGADRPGNTPHDEIMAFIINELKDAAQYLPSKSGKNDKKMAVRLTKEAAYAFLGKAQLFAKDYAGAKESLAKVINSNLYELVPGDQMQYLFHARGDASPEKIIELNYVNAPGVISSGNGAYHMQKSYLMWSRLQYNPDPFIKQEGWNSGGASPSMKFVEAIMANEPDSYRRKAWIVSYEELLTEYPYPTDVPGMTKEEKLMDPKRGLDGKKYNEIYCNCGWFSIKRAPYQEDLITNSSADTDENNAVMRYAEVLLMYAEACAMTGDDGSGLKALNEVQARAGAPVTALSMDQVKKERFFELYLEGVRYADLVRWGDAAKELADQGKVVPFLKDPFRAGGSEPHQAIIDVTDKKALINGSDYGFKVGKHELMPYPYSEIEVNPNIVQNPGWE